MLDKKITAAIDAWLASEEKPFAEGYALLQQVNQNRWMLQMLLRQQNQEKLEYELQKFQQIRHDGMDRRMVVLQEQEVKQVVAQVLKQTKGTDAKYAGKRADHDELPEAIQALWEQNQLLYAKMRKFHGILQEKLGPRFMPCDRYEEVKVLKETAQQLLANWERYDHYVKGESLVPEQNVSVVDETKQVHAAISYISRNRKKLEQLDGDALMGMLDKIQQRYDYLKEKGQQMDDQTLTYLADHGIKI